MAIPEQFSLRWNDFHANLSQGFHALLEGEDLVDVTLAAGGQYVHAHKLILSVCSPYFKELFKKNPCDHPIVILKDVSLSELRQVLQFMYRGEVHVRQQELPGFLHTAEMLQVKGLTAGRDQSESPQPQGPSKDESINRSHNNMEQSNDSISSDWVPGGEDTIATEMATPNFTGLQNFEDDSKSPLKRLLKTTNKTPYKKKKPRVVPDNAVPHDNSEFIPDGEPLLDFDSELFHSVLEVSDSKDNLSIKQEGWNCKSGSVKCPSCNRFFANRYNLKVHIRDKHDTLEGTLQCELCHKRMRNPSCLRVHMYHHRKQAAYLISQLAPDQLSSSSDQMKKASTSPKWGQDQLFPPSMIADADKEQDKSKSPEEICEPPSPPATAE